MNEDSSAGMIICMLLFVVVLMLGILIWEDTAHDRELVKCGCASYDSKTGAFIRTGIGGGE
jgi:hypothetical protein